MAYDEKTLIVYHALSEEGMKTYNMLMQREKDKSFIDKTAEFISSWFSDND